MSLPGLVFGAAASDRVACATGSQLDDLPTWTILVWHRPTTLTTNRNLVNKGAGAGNNRRLSLLLSGTSGAIQVQLDRATTDLQYISATGAVQINRDCFSAATFDSGASAGAFVAFYAGRAGVPATAATVATATDGSGAFQSDAGVALTIGNATTASPTVAWQGAIYAVAVSGSVLTVGEIRAWQENPFLRVRDLRGAWFLGGNGIGQVADYSAYSQRGTVTGAYPSPYTLPLAAVSMRSGLSAPAAASVFSRYYYEMAS